MRISISNIAWNVSDDKKIVDVLHKYQIDAIDIAPSKYFSDPSNITIDQIRKVKNWWIDNGIDIVGMQSLLFGTTGLNIFSTHEVQKKLLKYLRSICRIGSELSATKLVFGSPKNRDRSGFTDEQATAIAYDFFLKLGDIAYDYGVTICLEPNPTCYGSNFMTTTHETAFIVKTVNHPSIKMQLDTGAIFINKESIESIIAKYADIISHIHLSEPNLVPFGTQEENSSKYYKSILNFFPRSIATVEMGYVLDDPNYLNIQNALNFVNSKYK